MPTVELRARMARRAGAKRSRRPRTRYPTRHGKAVAAGTAGDCAADGAAAQPGPGTTDITDAFYRLMADIAETSPRGSAPDSIDRMVHALVGRATLGISPSAVALAYLDWLVHLATSPGKQAELVQKAFRKAARFWIYATRAQADLQAPRCIEPLPQDGRFRGDAWQLRPYNLIYQSFLLTQQWWFNATTGVRGVSSQNERIMEFISRQLLDIVAPSNFLPTNPEVQRRTAEAGGMNLVRGWINLIEDWERSVAGRRPVEAEGFHVGSTVAVTPGKVVHRNRLVELLQYAPATPQVHREPILVVPAWIMKYYILDLSPPDSLVKYLVDRGHTVFMISWKNPDVGDRDLGLDDYLRLGVMEALQAISVIVPNRRINGVGYCLGGTLLAIAAAAMARDGDERLKSLTLFAAQTDFTEAGELTMFINESQLTFLEDVMWEQGFLDTRQMAGTFQLLRSNDLIWSHMLKQYLLGERQTMNDLMAWNADATRMPARMHAEYLRRLFLDNDLAEGRYRVGLHPVALTDIRAPIFAVGTTRDHVAPWRSTYKIHLQTDTDVTYVLTTGGHNAGIVSEPGHPGRSFQIATKRATDKYEDPETWQTLTPKQDGSWWPSWEQWLVGQSSGQEASPSMGAPERGYPVLGAAPGSYVLLD